MNYFIIGGDKKEYGPASADQIRQWLREGRASGDTLLRPESETTWKPLRSFAEFQNDFASAPIAPPIPAQALPASEDYPVAANVPVSIGHAFARAWHLVAEHFGTIFGACLLVWMALTAVLMIPFVGSLVAMFLIGPLFGGLFLVVLKLIRTGEASAGDIFAFSGQNTFMLVVTGFIALTVSELGAACCCVIPGIYLGIAWLLAIPLVADRGLNFWQGLESSRRAVTPRWFSFFGLFLLSLLPFIVFSVYTELRVLSDSWPLVQQFQIEARGAMPTFEQIQKYAAESDKIRASYAAWFFVLHLLLLIVMPLGISSIAFVYEDLFGRKR
jgi:hypothetical protein